MEPSWLCTTLSKAALPGDTPGGTDGPKARTMHGTALLLISLGWDDISAEISKSPSLADGQLLEGMWKVQFWTDRDWGKFVKLGLILSGIKGSFKKAFKEIYKSRNYFQFKIGSLWTLHLLKASPSELSASSLTCCGSCIWNSTHCSLRAWKCYHFPLPASGRQGWKTASVKTTVSLRDCLGKKTCLLRFLFTCSIFLLSSLYSHLTTMIFF